MKKTWSLRWEMIVVLLLILVTIVSFSHIVNSYFEKQYSTHLLELDADVTSRLVQNISNQFSILTTGLESWSLTATVNRFLSTDNDVDRYFLFSDYENLRLSYKKMVPGLEAIVLQKKDGSFFNDPEARFVITQIQPTFSALEAGATSCLLVDHTNVYVALKQDVFQTGSIKKRIGSSLFLVDVHAIIGALEASDNRHIIIIDSNLKIVSSNCNLPVGETLPEHYRSFLSVADSHSNADSISVVGSCNKIDWTVLCVTPRAYVLAELKTIRNTTFLLFAGMLLLVAFIFLIHIGTLSFSFRRLITHIGAIGRGESVRPLRIGHSREFQSLSNAFNEMMDQLDKANQNNLEYHEKLLLRDLENKDSQLMALQSQINPHFLYNTLECINSAGALCGSREVEEMSTSLAFIFRYAIKGAKIVHLREELESLHYYLNIQQIRFPNRFDIRFEIAEELLERRMLKFLLQPLVENSIVHGFSECPPPWILTITAYEKDEKLFLQVHDNGRGLSTQKLKDLQEQLLHPDKEVRKIGLSNIYNRIVLYYGETYRPQLSSREGEGTTITLCLPILSPED